MKEIEEIKEWVIEEIGNSDSYLITVKIEEHWKAYKYVKFLLSHISSLEQRIVEMECAREADNKIASKHLADLVEAEAKVEELEGSFNRLTLDLIEAKRNHALELAERLKVEEKMKELEYQLRDDTGRIITMLRGRVEQAEARVEELETENNDILGELERAADKHLRNLWKLGEAESRIKELVEEGGQDCRAHNLMVEQLSERIKELEAHLMDKSKKIVDLKDELKLNASMLAKQCDLAREAEVRFKELEEETSRREKLFMEVVNKKEEYGEKLLLAEAEVIALRNAINKHEKFKRAHEKVVALEDEGLYTARKEV